FVKLFPKKVWAAESRLMKSPADHNGRPMVAPTIGLTFKIGVEFNEAKNGLYRTSCLVGTAFRFIFK
ncbi:MAG: hypothetical protein ACI4JM_08120, partial [Oscillospiraceae bacterium]